MGEFFQQQALLPAASRENQAYSAVAVVAGYGPLNDSSVRDSIDPELNIFLFIMITRNGYHYYNLETLFSMTLG